MGNVAVKWSIGGLEAATKAMSVLGRIIRVTLEHPEDLGTTPTGTLASISQLPAIRAIIEKYPDFFTVAGQAHTLAFKYRGHQSIQKCGLAHDVLFRPLRGATSTVRTYM